MFYNNYMEYFDAPIVFLYFVCTWNPWQRNLLQMKQNVLSVASSSLAFGGHTRDAQTTAILPSDLCIGFAAYTLHAPLTTSMIAC